ncbi:glucose-1-phosphate cytidylyltransferase [Candidatus Pelagibacter sp.]|nr:glucose-1-phosphate cytidylyltransferase [Candidatus Pelagibacter sp.]
MKAVILAGGLGSRIAEETESKPKPMVEIGGKPILWHIMKIYSSYGINDFIICCGYKGHVIKEYFNNYFIHMSDVTFSMKNNNIKIHHNSAESWNVTLVDTGESTMTGGRLKRVHDYIKNEDAFCMTYGDGVGNINIAELISFHKQHGKKATLTATRPSARYGALKLDQNGVVRHFEEKPEGEDSWINGGFFVLHPSVINLIKEDQTKWEDEPLINLAKEQELMAFKHGDFWMPMDTLREKIILNKLWESNKAPWKTW